MHSYFEKDIGTVFLAGHGIFIHRDAAAKGEKVILETPTTEVEFEEIEPIKTRSFDLDLTHAAQYELTPKDSTVHGPMTVAVNEMPDWFVAGSNTLQMSFVTNDSAHVVALKDPIEFEDCAAPMEFHAYLANHRARAALVLTVLDAETDKTTRIEIPFEEGKLGGKNFDGYQKISVPLPEDLRAGKVWLSIHYLGASEITSFPPFVFLANAALREVIDDPDHRALFLNPSMNLGELEDGVWLYARSKENYETFLPFFLRIGSRVSVLRSKVVDNARAYFDENYYEARNPDVDTASMDSYTHYLYQGWKDFRKPNIEFSPREYLMRNPGRGLESVEPLLHYANQGHRDRLSIGIFDERLREIWEASGRPIPDLKEPTVLSRAQDMMVPMNIIETRKLAVFVVPEHNSMSGGIYSIFSIADQLRRTRRDHGFDVMIMTRPNPAGLTYIRNSSFRNSETVYRFDQLRLFSEVSELQLHIPEYATADFVSNLSKSMIRYLMSRDKVHVNILNQNTRLMPKREAFRDLRRLCDSIGQSVSHHAFFGQEFADYYDLPSLLLPAYTDLTPYPPSSFAEKENLIIYSDDDARYREPVLDQLRTMTDYRLVKIRDITFDTYMDLATRCRFSVSFGEGFDGYVAQPMYQGGIGLALYTDEFFPDSSYKAFENFFDSEEEMISQIVPTIRRLEKDQKRYEALNRALRAKWDELYDLKDYHARIARLIAKDYEIMPQEVPPMARPPKARR